jgi:hypothetical protein
VHVAFDRFGRQAGMELHKRAWYQRADEVVSACGLQKSQYGPSYYVNIGFNFTKLDADPHPHPEGCHLTVRIGEFISDAEELELCQLLDLEAPITDSVRESRLLEIFTGRLEPVVRRATSVDGLRSMVADGTLPDYMLTLKAREVMGIPLQTPEARA